MMQDGPLPINIFQFLSSMAESGLIEISQHISALDVQKYHQINLRDIRETLSKLIIRTQTLIDNPIPVKMNEINLQNTGLDGLKIEYYREAFKNANSLIAKEISCIYVEQTFDGRPKTRENS